MRIGIYIHIPFCKRKCAYCDFLSSTNLSFEDEYLKKLKEEIVYYKNLYIDSEVDTVFIGGGTPSVLSRGALVDLFCALDKSFKLTEDVEVTVEANPDTLDEDKILEYSDFATRVSIGVQSLSDKVLKIAGRLHDEAGARRALKLLSGTKFDVSADLILGLPYDDLDSLTYSTKGVLDYGISHLSAYGLKVEEGTKFYKDYLSGKKFTDDDTVADMYDKVVDIANSYGLQRYEVSNFSRVGKECRHNVGYWTRKPYLGLGIGAHSLIDNVRYENTSSMQDYLNCSDFREVRGIEAKLSSDDALFEEIMLRLRLKNGIDVDEINKSYGIDFLDKFSRPIDKLSRVLSVTPKKISVKEQYFYALNSIIVEFFE